MTKSKVYFLIISVFITSSYGFSQEMDFEKLQFGFAVKTTIDINGLESKGKYTNFNVTLVGGIGNNLFDIQNVYPSLHAGILIYNRGDLVSSYKERFFQSTVIDLIFDITLTAGLKQKEVSSARIVPLYHFSDFTPNPLENPFRWSVSGGLNFIYSFDRKNREKKPQRVGFMNLLIGNTLQVNTYNDGSAFKFLGTDKLDRYYTGGFLLASHLDRKWHFDQIELSFHKFTGFQKYAYKSANLMQIDFIPFSDPDQYYINKNRTRISVSNTSRNYGLHLTFHNTDADLQDLIHYLSLIHI